MRRGVTPKTSVFFAGFDPTLHNFYTVPDCTCALYDAVFANTLACESVGAAGATISRSGLFQRSGLGNLSNARVDQVVTRSVKSPISPAMNAIRIPAIAPPAM